ncbi:MAG: DNA-binding protein [Lachnospiraceae bacterium]|nr:DNA-binding protein [Lachnospiraceae bacterium]
MEKIVKQSLLYDFYGELLNEHQRQVYEDAVFNDMSVTEISENYGITRQGAHDMIKRCDRILSGYEEKLKLLHRFSVIRDCISQIEDIADPGMGAEFKKIRALTEKIKETL